MDAHRQPDIDACIRHCSHCHDVCVQAAALCAREGGELASGDRIGTLQLCADICRISADAMLRPSQLHSLVCRTAAEICAACAASCEVVSESYALLGECARSCWRCVDSCSAMAFTREGA
jgi:hypothetical protein